ncbi:sortase domain-bontaining protein [Streptomyces caniferus]|uniref:sortase domain-containing protein n=1 Tax=Streptomyces caniferus TaxID=285557 RepID=UPI003714F848
MSTEEQGRAGATAGAPARSGTGGGAGVHGSAGAAGARAVCGMPGALSASSPRGTLSSLVPLDAHPHTSPHADADLHTRGGAATVPTTVTSPHGTSRSHTPGSTPGKLLAGVAWAVLLLGLWLWGRDLADGVAAQLATTGDVAAAGRPLGRQAPPHAHAPVPAAVNAEPVRITIDALGIREGGIAARGLDEHGILTPPPDTAPDLFGWYAAGPRPGEAGAALLVGRTGADRDPRARRTVVHRLTALKPGERVDIQRSDGSTARFAVEDVQLYDRDRFDARKAYAARDRGRSELRLIADAGGRGRAGGRVRDGGSANVVVVSAYLTSVQRADAEDG